MLDLRREESLDAARATAAEDNATLRLFEVWLSWREDRRALYRRVKPEAVLEQFTLLTARPTDEDAHIWRCSFEHRGQAINFDRQTISLLRRLTPIAVWTRAERSDAPVLTGEGEIDLAWRDFGRRALP